MKSLNGYRMKLMLFGFVAAVLFGGGSVKGDFTFGVPVNLGPTVNSSASDCWVCISSDGLELYFSSDRLGSLGPHDIWVARRTSVSDSWQPPINPGSPLNGPGLRNFPCCLSVDDLELYFVSYNRSGGYGSYDIWVARRETRDHDWEQPTNLGPMVNRSSYDDAASISHDGLELYFCSDRSGGIGSFDIWVSNRATKNDPWTEAINLGAIVNSSARDACPCLSADGRLLLFSGLDNKAPYRPGGFGGSDMWMTKRASISDPWDTPVNLGSIINSPSFEEEPRLSSDGSTLYFSSNRPGGYGGFWGDIWQAPIIPIVDLNGDGIVDSADMCIMVDHWGTDEPLCDIGPMPWGDGFVDVQDLIVLAEHLFEEIYPIELVAYWKLDEEEGDIAYNSTSDNHGILNGNPTWQPDSGRVAGALEFDGIDDYIGTDFVLSPADGAFSVFAWITGGAPGQVIISQSDDTFGGSGETWFGMDPSDGKLMTGLTPPPGGRSVPQPFVSELVVIDNQWHHIGFVWDGSIRALYVDCVEVAKDTQAKLGGSDGGLHIGAGTAMEPGSFWSGLIDDVRIYNVALSAEKIAALAQ